MTRTILAEIRAGHVPDLAQLSVGQFHQLIEHGILREGQDVELIDGLLIHKDHGDRGRKPMIHGPRHALCVKKLQRVGYRDIDSAACHLLTQLPLTLSDELEPEPDGAVVRGRPEDYVNRHPGPDDVCAVIEISDSSLNYDRTTKQRVYASAGIRVYWIVNIPERQVEIHDRPDAERGAYLNRTDVPYTQTARLVTGCWPTVAIEVSHLLP